ncbi:MAG TPA: FAD-dependent monooxygenase [Acidobacteriota bacterium]
MSGASRGRSRRANGRAGAGPPNSATKRRRGSNERPRLPSFHVGRVALTGGAAHAMIPVVGQGANQSFEDAMVLARELAKPVAAPAAVR